MAIHKLENGTFVISANQMWLSGVYDSEKSAKFSFKLSDSEKTELMNIVLSRGDDVITWDDISEFRKTTKP